MNDSLNGCVDVSVIVVNYHTIELVKKCVGSIFEHTSGLAFEVIVVDNSTSIDEFKALSGTLLGKAKVINAGSNLGFGKANNLGATMARGNYLFFLNSDTLLMNNAILELYLFARSHNSLGVCAGALFDSLEKPTCSFFKKEYSLKNIQKSNRLFNMVFRHLFKRADFNYYSNPILLDGYVSGADLLIERNLFNEVGGFDPDIFMYGEDALLCFQVRSVFHKEIWQIPSAKIIHYEGQSSHGFSAEKAKMYVDGTYLYFKKAFGDKVALDYLLYSWKSNKRRALFFQIFKNNKKNRFSVLSVAFFKKIAEVQEGC